MRVGALRLSIALIAIGVGCASGKAMADTVLITGANQGIGLEFAKEYAARGWTVIATHRRSTPPRSLTDLAARYRTIRIEKLDVTEMAQVQALARKLADVPIDVLI